LKLNNARWYTFVYGKRKFKLIAAILAGGYGTRLGEITETIPKPMVKIGGKPILWHIMKYFSTYGITEFVVLGGYQCEVIKKYFADFELNNSDIRFSLADGKRTYLSESSENWRVTVLDTGLNVSTGTRLLKAKNFLESSGQFFLTYGDGLSDIDLDKMREQYKNTNCDAMLAGVNPPGRYGQLNIECGKVVSFHEKAPESGYINGGFFIFNNNIFDSIPMEDSSLEVDVLTHVASKGKLNVFEHNGYWQSMDTPRDVRILEDLWALGTAPWKKW
jgi:glucose-1-phosphate cytidylyltransferase